MAARRGHVEIARALLDCGAAVDARDRKDDTPLQRAINCRRDMVAQLLVERGAGHCETQKLLRNTRKTVAV
jgi:ankyrin repeat protein